MAEPVSSPDQDFQSSTFSLVDVLKPRGPLYLSFLDRFVRFGAMFVGSIGIVVLTGWIFHIDILTRMLPGLTMMKSNSALAFLAAGAALWLLHDSASESRRQQAGLVLAASLVLLGSLTLAQDLFGIELGIDQLVLRDVSAAANSPPGRMVPPTAIGFAFVGVALLALKSRQLWLASRVQWFVIPPLFVAVLAIVGYAYGVSSLYRVGAYPPMAANTALAFFALSLSILAADPEHGIASIVTSDTDGGVVARWLLATIPTILFGLGWLPLAGQKAGFYDTRFGLALMVLLSIAVSTTIVSFTAVRLHGADLKRRAAESEIVGLNLNLEKRVLERTQELENSLAQVKQLGGLLPICAWCKNVRDDKDYWQSVEEYLSERTDARFSHGICPDCLEKVEQEP